MIVSMDSTISTSVINDLKSLLVSPNAFRSLLVLVLSMIAAYWLSKFLARGLIFIAQRIGRRSDNESDEARVTRLRQTETYLSVSIAIIRTLVVVSGWLYRLANPSVQPPLTLALRRASRYWCWCYVCFGGWTNYRYRVARPDR